MVGVIQEQHAERCRLFQQWKQLKFPVVQDLLNTNGIAVVPVYVGVDEHGIVRKIPRNPKALATQFLDKKFPAPTEAPADVVAMDQASPDAWRKKVAESETPKNRLGLADALILWNGKPAAIRESIEIYQALAKAVEHVAEEDAISPEEKKRLAKIQGQLHFRLGAAHRLLFEAGGQADGRQFQSSVKSWEQALAYNPNQYIYRRRIQQYGPRLKKPYSFYDWVHTARTEIAARGEDPIPLSVEPNGAEFAKRARKFEAESEASNPDPDAKIISENGRLVRVQTTLVPTNPKPGDVVAVHINFKPKNRAKWNHETTPLEMWVDMKTDTNVEFSSKLVRDSVDRGHMPESTDTVSLSFELKIPETAMGTMNLNGYALFNICESENGTCLYRRRNFEYSIPIRSASSDKE